MRAINLVLTICLATINLSAANLAQAQETVELINDFNTTFDAKDYRPSRPVYFGSNTFQDIESELYSRDSVTGKVVKISDSTINGKLHTIAPYALYYFSSGYIWSVDANLTKRRHIQIAASQSILSGNKIYLHEYDTNSVSFVEPISSFRKTKILQLSSNQRFLDFIGAADGKTYFTIKNSANQTELYVNNGTLTGNTLLLSGDFSISAVENNKDLDQFAYNGKIYFSLWRGNDFRALYSSDGSIAQTKQLKQLHAAGSPILQDLTVMSGKLYFIYDNRLFISDFTDAGTKILDTTQSMYFSDLYFLQNNLYFADNSRLFSISDSGLKDISTEKSVNKILDATIHSGAAYLLAEFVDGTSNILKINGATTQSLLSGFPCTNNYLESLGGYILYSTAFNTNTNNCFSASTNSSFSNPKHTIFIKDTDDFQLGDIYREGKYLYFTGDDYNPNTPNIWRTDFNILENVSGYGESVATLRNGTLLSITPSDNYLKATNNKGKVVTLAKAISSKLQVKPKDSLALFSSHAENFHTLLNVTDGTLANTKTILDLDFKVLVRSFSLKNGFAFIIKDYSTNELTVGVTDGTASGTKIVYSTFTDLKVGLSSDNYLVIGSGKDTIDPSRFVISDGSINGTSVTGFDPAKYGFVSEIDNIQEINNSIYIYTSGMILISDGNKARDKLLNSIDQDNQYLSLSPVGYYDNKILFSSGSYLYYLDSNDKFTFYREINADVCSGVTLKNNLFWFFAETAETGCELWKSDLSLAGTKLVADINQGPSSSKPGRDPQITAGDNSIYLYLYNDQYGHELYRVILSDQCPNTSFTIQGACGCGTAERDANLNGITDCLEPTPSSFPKLSKAKVSVKGTTISVTLPKYRGYTYEYTLTLSSSKKIIKASSKNKLSFARLKKGNWKLSYRIVRKVGIANFYSKNSSQAKFKIK